MESGKVLEEGMEKVRFTIDELLTQLRKKGIFYLDEVDLAILETDGKISVLRQPLAMATTRQDVDSIRPSRGQPQVFILDGHLLPYSLEAIGKDQQWVQDTLDQWQVADMKKVIVAQVDAQDKVYIDTKKDKAVSNSDR